MRRGFFFLLMVVLVLRGLTGTAMAAGIVAPLLPAGPAHQTTALHQDHRAGSGHDEQAGGSAHDGHDGHHDHHSDEAAASHATACQDASTGGADHDHHSASCSACEICHSAMLGLPASLTPIPLSAGALLPLASAQFDSVPAAQIVKPPIA